MRNEGEGNGDKGREVGRSPKVGILARYGWEVGRPVREGVVGWGATVREVRSARVRTVGEGSEVGKAKDSRHGK